MSRVLQAYTVVADDVPADVRISETPEEFVPVYEAIFPRIEPATRAVLDAIRERMIEELDIKPMEVLGPEEMATLKKKFLERSRALLKEELPNMEEKYCNILTGILMHKSLGLDAIEILLQDKELEEIVINSAKEPIWVYHRSIGWLKTNIQPRSEVEIYNYSSLIGRRVGTQVTHLRPLMDAYLTTGDRANATLFPISSGGNTLTIRKFARRPWTITDFMESGTISPDMAAFLWLALQYELNVLISGGTASGKTALLNVLAPFIPPNDRIISIEDTREIQLPKFLHWVPLTTRPPNPEGKGEVGMLPLMINALRMRPDRVIVGEIRRTREAEVLFEAIHTGHSVYSTFHSNTDDETLRRLVNPPLNIPPALLGSLHLVVVMHRDRRKETRRVLSISEIVGAAPRVELNRIFQWVPSTDKFIRLGASVRAVKEMKFFSGMSDAGLKKDLSDKKLILQWFLKKDLKDIHEVGRIVSQYYVEPEKVLDSIRKGKKPKTESK
ncbi:MAG: type II/IV secretion system ATPase subunit [Candidatus Aenigmatarchaeota archaeon]